MGGSPDGIRTHKELVEVPDLTVFVAGHVRRVIQEDMPARARQSMPRRYLELEETRLIRLMTEWLRYESARAPFAVIETETRAAPTIAGLTLDVRLDRIDRLKDGSVLVIDYKSGDVSPKCWDLPRHDDVQLPLYAGFALDREEGPLGGMVFAKIRPGNNEFVGRVKDAKANLLNDLNSNHGLVQNSLNEEELTAWSSYIEKMALDFLAGRADVDPRDYPETCECCGLQALCRVQENQPGLDANEDEDAAEADDA